jgi:hypothetical protein
MRPVLSALLAFITTLLRSRLALQREIVALRHQVAVSQQSISRPRLHAADRLLWSWLAWLWPGGRTALAFVPPGTIIALQKTWFRDHWRPRSQSGKPGRPAMAKAVCALIWDMW